MWLVFSLVLCVSSQNSVSSAQTALHNSTKQTQQDQRVDINHASVEELQKIPGISRGWAERVVRFRPYHSRLDLLEHGIVPDSVYDAIKDSIVAHQKPPAVGPLPSARPRQ